MSAFRLPEPVGRPVAFCRALFRLFLIAALAIAFFQRLALAQSAPAPRSASSGPAAVMADPFPIAVGNAWIYEGTVWWMPRGLRKIYRERVTWTMEITDALRRGPWTAAVLHGHPYDLVWYENGRERGTYLLLMRTRKDGSSRVFLLRGHRAWDAWRRLKDRKDPLEGLAGPGEILLEMPLSPGKRFCPVPPSPPGESTGQRASAERAKVREPACWTVSEEGPADLRAVQGAEELVHDPVLFSVRKRTRADHAVWTIVPGLGFTSYAYGHNGEISAVELELVDFHSPTAIADTAQKN